MPTPTLAGRTAAILIASDRCHAGAQTDLSGPALHQLLSGQGAEITQTIISPDDLSTLTQHLQSLADAQIHLIVTTGGTGLGPRDNTPEATLAVATRQVPGLAELLRQEGRRQTPFASLSRCVCAIAGRSLILNLPGNPTGATTSLQLLLPLLPHALNLLAGQTDH